MKIERTQNLFKKEKLKERSGARNIIAVHYEDLRSYEFINNSVLAQILNKARAFMMSGIEVRFINTPGEFKKALKALGLEDMFKVED